MWAALVEVVHELASSDPLYGFMCVWALVWEMSSCNTCSITNLLITALL